MKQSIINISINININIKKNNDKNNNGVKIDDSVSANELKKSSALLLFVVKGFD
jgi:hypothetical protein